MPVFASLNPLPIFRHFLPGLTYAGFRIIGVDQPGYGGSPGRGAAEYFSGAGGGTLLMGEGRLRSSLNIVLYPIYFILFRGCLFFF